jgi:hypothetical protein
MAEATWFERRKRATGVTYEEPTLVSIVATQTATPVFSGNVGGPDRRDSYKPVLVNDHQDIHHGNHQRVQDSHVKILSDVDRHPISHLGVIADMTGRSFSQPLFDRK